MVFNLKVVCNIKTETRPNITKIFDGNRRSDCTQLWPGKKLTVALYLSHELYSSCEGTFMWRLQKEQNLPRLV